MNGAARGGWHPGSGQEGRAPWRGGWRARPASRRAGCRDAAPRECGDSFNWCGGEDACGNVPVERDDLFLPDLRFARGEGYLGGAGAEGRTIFQVVGQRLGRDGLQGDDAQQDQHDEAQEPYVRKRDLHLVRLDQMQWRHKPARFAAQSAFAGGAAIGQVRLRNRAGRPAGNPVRGRSPPAWRSGSPWPCRS